MELFSFLSRTNTLALDVATLAEYIDNYWMDFHEIWYKGS